MIIADKPEQRARLEIDRQLVAAGWDVQDRAAMNLGAAAGVAIREFQTSAGPADYLLFLGNLLVGVVEAKKAGVTLSSVEAQTREYAEKAPTPLQVPVRPLPFLYESTGIETWFTNGLDADATARAMFSFHRPETLREWLDAELARQQDKPGAAKAPTLKGRMRLAPPLNPAGMWPAQIRAVENLEASFRGGKPRALVQMATGSGKTFAAISSIYRLVSEGGARRVLFLVDRGNLGRQALKEFQVYTTPDDGRKFTELYNVVNLSHNKVEPVNKVVITTIQRLYSILKGEESFDDELEEGSAFVGAGSALVREAPPVVYSPLLPPEFFDVVVIDECHRSIYSLWRQVLEYFDATLVGLTATPDARTYAFFNKNVVSEYTHIHAVRDRVNVPFQVYELRTRVTEGGAQVVAEPDTVVGKRDRQTRQVRWETLEEDIVYTASQVDRSVVVPDQIRTVLRELRARMFTDIFPGRSEIPKTLIFAKSDDHAEDILRILREEWSLSNEAAVKVTYKPERLDDSTKRKSASHKPEELIQAFRNSYNPRVAITVDMIATGTDIKPLECVVFLRAVKSRGLFEQMKGRGVRVIPDADFQAVTPDAKQKTHFVVVDCVGVMEEQKADPPLDRERGISFPKLLELVRAGNRDEDVLSTLAARLDRMERQLTPDQRELLESASGGVALIDVIAGILDRLDPNVEDERARQMAGLPAAAEPNDAQLQAAQAALREEAAAPIAYAPKLCAALLEVRKAQDVTLDVVTIDEITRSGARADLANDYDADKALIGAFEQFCDAYKDEIDALMVLYARPYAQRLTRKQLMELVAAINRPPRQWTGESLWAAYERVEQGRVRGASRGRMLTDLISLTRHAMGIEPELISYADQAAARFDHWLAQQANTGRQFTAEQQGWLEMIRDRIVVDLEVRLEDFDDMPFVEKGGLGKVWSLFGEELEVIVDELNRELVA
ncbi:MAG: DEAD/DEAH box helicase family protein [Bradymonadaceae bacterium]|nr:DEAD/DEAH box helicase family protein [Lujinxingiaceae bacterium]